MVAAANCKNHVRKLDDHEANIGPQPLSFNGASAAKLEFGAKNRPKPQDTSSFRLEVAKH